MRSKRSCAWWQTVPRRELAEVAQEAGAELLCAASLKAALDRDWDQLEQREEALGLVLQVLHLVESWVQTLPQEETEEALLVELRHGQQTAQGRSKLRERVAVEHSLAHVGRWQGRRARYRGLRKNLFDLRRCAVVHNLHVLARSQSLQADLQDVA